MAATGQRCGLVLGLLLACSLATTLSAQTLDLTSTITLVTRGKQFGDSDCLFMKGLLEYVATEYIDPSSVSNPTSGFLRSECQFNHTGIDPWNPNVRTSELKYITHWSMMNQGSLVLMKQVYDTMNNVGMWDTVLRNIGAGCNSEGKYEDFFMREGIAEDTTVYPPKSTTQTKVACAYAFIDSKSSLISPGRNCDFLTRTIGCNPPPPRALPRPLPPSLPSRLVLHRVRPRTPLGVHRVCGRRGRVPLHPHHPQLHDGSPARAAGQHLPLLRPLLLRRQQPAPRVHPELQGGLLAFCRVFPARPRGGEQHHQPLQPGVHRQH